METSHKSCCCNHEWCTREFRSRHAFPHQYVRFTTLADQIEIWNSSLIIDSTTTGNSKKSTNLRVWVAHFHEEDINIQVVEGADNSLCCIGIHEITRHKFSSRNSRIGQLPRPEVTASGIEHSWFFQNPNCSSYT